MAETATRVLLADALKTLTSKMPFSKISVTEICRQCSINRKSFYYHFQDKFDLVNWIFDTEFAAFCADRVVTGTSGHLLCLLEYFNQNKAFYRKVLLVHGQNSFSEYFRQLLHRTLTRRYSSYMKGKALEFYADFFSDAMVCSIVRWIVDRSSIPPQEFLSRITECITGLAAISFDREDAKTGMHSLSSHVS